MLRPGFSVAAGKDLAASCSLISLSHLSPIVSLALAFEYFDQMILNLCISRKAVVALAYKDR